MWRAIALIPIDGQSPTTGARLLWKKVQKKLKKNKTSDAIKSINPNRKLLFTFFLKSPLDLSPIKSYIQAIIPTTKNNMDIIIIL